MADTQLRTLEREALATGDWSSYMTGLARSGLLHCGEPHLHPHMQRYAVIVRQAKMPSRCWGQYRRVGVVRLVRGCRASDVTMLSNRSKAVEEVIETWERVHVGKTERCSYARALEAAIELADRLEREEIQRQCQNSSGEIL